MTPVLTKKSLPDELRRIAKTMRAAQIQQFSGRDCELLREAASRFERRDHETLNLLAGLEGLRDALRKDSLHDLADLVQSAMERIAGKGGAA